MDGLRTEVCGQQKQSNDPHNNQHNPTRAFAGVIIGAPMATPSAIPWGMTDPRRRWGIAPPPIPAPHTHVPPQAMPHPLRGATDRVPQDCPAPAPAPSQGEAAPPALKACLMGGAVPHPRGGGGGARAICSAPGHWVTRKTAGAVGHGHDHEGPLNAEAPKATPRGRGPSGGLRQPPPKRGCPSSVNGAHTPLPPPPFVPRAPTSCPMAMGGGAQGRGGPLPPSHDRPHGAPLICPPPPPRVTFRRVIVSLRGPGQSPVLPFACCVGSLCSVGRCSRCSCWCRFRVRGAHWLVCRGCAGCGGMCRLCVSGAQSPPPPLYKLRQCTELFQSLRPL